MYWIMTQSFGLFFFICPKCHMASPSLLWCIAEGSCLCAYSSRQERMLGVSKLTASFPFPPLWSVLMKCWVQQLSLWSFHYTLHCLHQYGAPGHKSPAWAAETGPFVCTVLTDNILCPLTSFPTLSVSSYLPKSSSIRRKQIRRSMAW